MNRMCLAMALSLTSFITLANPASAQDRVKAGTLDCDVAGGIGLIIGSQKAAMCTYISNRGHREIYEGRVSKFGLDIGATDRARLIWAVFAPTHYPPYGLTGNYVGATAEATVGAGVGANVLVGGSNDTISLQPLSVSAQTGLNIAAGVGGLELRPAAPPPPVYRRHR